MRADNLEYIIKECNGLCYSLLSFDKYRKVN